MKDDRIAFNEMQDMYNFRLKENEDASIAQLIQESSSNTLCCEQPIG